MIKAAIEFTRAVATVEFKRAIATVEFKRAIAAVEIQRSLSAIELRRALAAIEFGDFMTFKFFTDEYAISDAIVTAVNKPLAESSTINDLAAKEISKGFADSFGARDTFVVIPYKNNTDRTDVNDSFLFLFNKRPDEPITLSLSTSKRLEKTISDLITATDLVSVSDLESASKDVDHVGNATDLGSVLLQNYATDYFADDYVGEKRTF